jgi:hypothetical protein
MANALGLATQVPYQILVLGGLVNMGIPRFDVRCHEQAKAADGGSKFEIEMVGDKGLEPLTSPV